MYYLTKLDDVIYSSFWVIPKIKFANLCKPIHDIISYSTSIWSFESRKCGKEEKKLQRSQYLEREKNFLEEIKNISLMGYHLMKKQNFDKKLRTQASIN